MSIFGSWVVTVAFCFIVFLVGKALQVKERRDRLTRRAMESLKRREPAEPATYGTIFGGPTQYDRRSKIF
jgi:hypothetical protein